MDTSTVLLIAIPVIVLATVVLYATARRRDTDAAVGTLSRETVRADRSDESFLAAEQPEVVSGREYERQVLLERRGGTDLVPVEAAPLAPYVPPDPETLGVTRRQFFNRSIVTMFGIGLAGFGGSVLAFLWPQQSGGFGGEIRVGKVDDVLATIGETREPFYVPEGRFYVQAFPAEAVSKAEAVYQDAVLPGMEAGVVALYQKCPHLGCRVPWCGTSQWFECPCHGSQYNRVGEKKGGPAPRGLDRFAVNIDGGVMTVDTGAVVPGPAIGTNTTGQEAEGPHCIDSGEGGH